MKNRAKFFTTIYIIPCVAIALLFAYLMLDFFVIPTEEIVSPEQILMSTPARTEMPAGNDADPRSYRKPGGWRDRNTRW